MDRAGELKPYRYRGYKEGESRPLCFYSKDREGADALARRYAKKHGFTIRRLKGQ